MIIETVYPYRRDISSPIAIRENLRKVVTHLVANSFCIGKKQINSCIINVYYQKKSTKNGKIYSRYYYTHEDFKIILEKVVKYYLIDVNIESWNFIPIGSNIFPRVILKINKMS